MTVLLGLPWQYFQIAYAFHTALPLMLLTWYLLICSPFKNPFFNITGAAVLTSLLLWSKINAGMFLFAGGMFYCFFWLSTPRNNVNTVDGNRTIQSCFKIIQIFGLLVYGAVFTYFIHKYLDKLYFYYLLGPLLIGLAWTLRQTLQNQDINIVGRIQLWFSYSIATVLITILLLFGIFGWEGGIQYVKETLEILSHLDYMVPVPPLGKKGSLKGFNEYFWPQLPWLFTFLFCIWLFVQSDSKGRLVFRRNWSTVRARISGLSMLVVLNSFVMYSRSDEAHIIQAIIPSVPVIFILLFHIEKFITFRLTLYYPIVWRAFIVMFVVLSIFTIGEISSLNAFKWGNGDWHHDNFQYLKFRKDDNESHALTKGVLYREWNKMTNAAALYIDKITVNDTEVLILIENQLLNLLSNTLPVGGRHQYLFYLLRSNLIDRESFDKLVPPSILENLLTNPPKVIVGGIDYPPLLKTIPEFKTLLAQRYVKTRAFADILIYERVDNKQ